MAKMAHLAGFAVCALVCGSAMAGPITGQAAAAQDKLVAEERAKIQSDDWNVQISAFDAITDSIRMACGGPYSRIKPECATSSAKQAISDLLAQTVARKPQAMRRVRRLSAAAAVKEGEENEEYLPTLIETVLELHDRSSIAVLYQPYILNTGGMVTDALAYFGRTEAPHIVDLYVEKNGPLYHSSVAILSMLQQGTIDSAVTMARVRTIFLDRSRSRNDSDRLAGASGLSYFNDAEARQRLADMAAHDPFSLVTPLNEREFPVREAARRALERPFVVPMIH